MLTMFNAIWVGRGVAGRGGPRMGNIWRKGGMVGRAGGQTDGQTDGQALVFLRI